MFRQYENTFIVNAHLPGERVDATIDKIIKYIEGSGGKVKFVDRWGKRRLAYEIAKKQYGYYVYVRFEAEGSFIKEFERELKLDDSILRFLTVIVPKAVLKDEVLKKSKTGERSSKEIQNRLEASHESSPMNGDPVPPEEKEQGE
jgi:small subunit ribosomal protein S6